MNICPETIYANGLDYVCHKAPGHPGKHRDNVINATWADGDVEPTHDR